jgi:hypothetical protein
VGYLETLEGWWVSGGIHVGDVESRYDLVGL